MASIGANRHRVEPLNGAQARFVVAAGGSLVAPDAVEPIVRVAAGDPRGKKPLDAIQVDPALLSLFCRELNERRKVAGLDKITKSIVEGDRGSTFRRYSEAVIREAAPEVRRFVEERLITPSGAQARITEDSALSLPGVTPDAIDTLVELRLIRRTERADRTLIELSHEVLTKSVAENRQQRLTRSSMEAIAVQRTSKIERIVYATLLIVALLSATLGYFAFCSSRR